MTSLQGLSKIRLVPNKNYKRSGTKSYVHLLKKWGFEPTKPGPYVQINRTTETPGSFHKFGHKARTQRVLTKKTATGENGEVPAQDQQNDSEYLCPVQIGTPAQTLMLDFDTGSSDLWVWSTELPKSTTSNATGHTIFNSAKSSTFKASKTSKWEISYGDSSSASGTVGTDIVTIGGLAIKNQAVELASKLSDQFEGSPGDGLLGLAWGSINTVTPEPVATPVMNMITQDDIPSDAKLFTVNLGSWRDAKDPDKGASFYTFGYIDQATVGNQEIAYTPVDNSQGFWMFDSTSATVNGTTITQSKNQAIADTGTTLALVSDEVCEAIYAAIPGSSYNPEYQGYIFPSNASADDLPIVTFAVGDKQFAVQKEDLGFAEASTGMVYGGIQSRGSLPFDILGDTFLKGIYAIFDQGNKQFGAVQRSEPNQNTEAPPAS
ncbi:hypothetical protein NHQ30_009975 [Ciborinia camelliae]|nr:hypothetical protein NHQ30_009975 [Ciborinia camelliae]